MDWLLVVLTRNCWRGMAGFVVEVPRAVAELWIADGRARSGEGKVWRRHWIAEGLAIV